MLILFTAIYLIDNIHKALDLYIFYRPGGCSAKRSAHHYLSYPGMSERP